MPFDCMIRMLPVFFSVKKIRPSGAKARATGKLALGSKTETCDVACVGGGRMGATLRVSSIPRKSRVVLVNGRVGATVGSTVRRGRKAFLC